MKIPHPCQWSAAALLSLIVWAPRAGAFSAGIATNNPGFGPFGCNGCHASGTSPTVLLSGPDNVLAGSTNEYSVAIVAVGSQNHGGFNVSASAGTLATGGASSANTQALPGTGGLTEITHSSPKMADAWSMIVFSFLWTAPAFDTSVTMSAWGNAVNNNGNTSGDAALNVTLNVTVTGSGDTPTPSATPTVTPTPEDVCSIDLDPLKPYLIADRQAQKCQEAIAKAGLAYVKGKLKAVQRCLNLLQKGKRSGDAVTLCRGTLGTPPADATTAEKIAKAIAKAEKFLDNKCTDALVPPRLCSDTVAGLKMCLIENLWQRTDALIQQQYGDLALTSDKGVQKCQQVAAKAATGYVARAMKAMQLCLNKRNKDCQTGNAAERCLGELVSGSYGEPSDGNTAEKLAAAETKMRSKITGACNNQQAAMLDACADDVNGLEDCLLCTHREGLLRMIGAQYGGANVFADPTITLQAAVSSASPGDIVMLDPGTYSEAVVLSVQGLKLIGETSCGGARAMIENPGGQGNGIFAAGLDDLLFENFEVNNFDANDIFVTNADGVTFRNLTTRGPGTPTGTEYGIFPIFSNNVLVENCTVSGVRDAGIYVGESTNIVIRNNEVFGNVAGIEVENSGNAEVYGNYAHDNTGGILVFKLAGLPVQLSNCHDIHDNIVTNNNTPNFGSGIVGLVPRGTGMIVLSNDDSLFRNNLVTGNDSFGIAVTDQVVLNALFDPDPFPTTSPDPVVENNQFVDNVFTGNGGNPDPSVSAFASDTLFVAVGASGNCQSGNMLNTSFGFSSLPACTLPATLPPGCPVPPLMP